MLADTVQKLNGIMHDLVSRIINVIVVHTKWCVFVVANIVGAIVGLERLPVLHSFPALLLSVCRQVFVNVQQLVLQQSVKGRMAVSASSLAFVLRYFAGLYFVLVLQRVLLSVRFRRGTLAALDEAGDAGANAVLGEDDCDK